MTVFYCHACRGKSEEICPEHGPAKTLLSMEMLDECGQWDDPDEDHACCPGLRELGEGVILCVCPCHLTAADWFKIAHWSLEEPVEG